MPRFFDEVNVPCYFLQLNLRLSIRKKETLHARQERVSIIKPRGFILIGKKGNWSPDKKAALRKLNFHLHRIEVLTYSDLVERGKAIAQMYSE